ncbi:MAG: hypothetical protein PIR02_07445 [Microbacterium enclense]
MLVVSALVVLALAVAVVAVAAVALARRTDLALAGHLPRRRRATWRPRATAPGARRTIGPVSS